MAYLLEITPPHCNICGAVAKVRVYNWKNQGIGPFCKRHGTETVAELKRAESKSGAHQQPRGES